MSAKLSGDALLDKIKPKKRTGRTAICMRTDLIDEWETANTELQQARAQDMGAGRLSNGGISGESRTAAERVAKLEAEIADAQMWFEFENMDPHEFSELKAEHPPRKGDQFDMLAGYNRDAVEDESVRKCLIEPQFSDDGWDRLVAVMPPGEWSELRRACNEVNGRQGSTLPKSVLAEQILAAKRETISTSRKAGG